MRAILEMGGRSAAIATVLCLASCGLYKSTEPTEDTQDIDDHNPDCIIYTDSDEVPPKTREPTPCLEARDPDMYPIRQLDEKKISSFARARSGHPPVIPEA